MADKLITTYTVTRDSVTGVTTIGRSGSEDIALRRGNDLSDVEDSTTARANLGVRGQGVSVAADTAALAAIAAASRQDGELVVVEADGKLYRYDLQAVSGDVAPSAGAGYWLEVTGGASSGGDMLAANNLDDVADVATARANLGVEIPGRLSAYTTAQRNALGAVAEGLLIYNTDRDLMQLRVGSVWRTITFDLTAPSLSAWTNTARTITSLTGTLNLSEDSTLYWVAYPSAQALPTDAQISSGLDATNNAALVSGNRFEAAGSGISIAVTGLPTTQGTSYSVAVTAEDLAGNLAIPVVHTASTLDGVGPTLTTFADAAAAATTSLSYTIESSETGTIYIALYTSSQGALTGAQVETRSAILGAAEAVAAATGETRLVSGLTIGTTYFGYAVAKDAAGNYSSVTGPLTLATISSFAINALTGFTSAGNFYEAGGAFVPPGFTHSGTNGSAPHTVGLVFRWASAAAPSFVGMFAASTLQNFALISATGIRTRWPGNITLATLDVTAPVAITDNKIHSIVMSANIDDQEAHIDGLASTAQITPYEAGRASGTSPNLRIGGTNATADLQIIGIWGIRTVAYTPAQAAAYHAALKASGTVRPAAADWWYDFSAATTTPATLVPGGSGAQTMTRNGTLTIHTGLTNLDVY